MQELTLQKQKAVASENFVEAQRCKDAIEYLLRIAAQLIELENHKKAAVMREDFEAAHRIKVEIEKLRNMDTSANSSSNKAKSAPVSRQQTPMQQPKQQVVHETSIPQQPMEQQEDVKKKKKRKKIRNVFPEQEQAPTFATEVPQQQDEFDQQYDAPKQDNAHEADVQQSETAALDDQSKAKNHDEQPIRPARNNIFEEMNVNDPNAFGFSDNPFSSSVKVPTLVEDYSNKSKKKKFNNDEVVVAAISDRPQAAESDNESFTDLPAWEQGMISFVRNVEEKEPSAMPKAEDHAILVRVFGTYISKCLLDQKERALRAAAVRSIMNKMNDLPSDKIALFQAVCHYMRMGLNDKITNVYIACLELLHETVAFCSKHVKKAVAQPSIDPVIALLVSKCCESNTKVKDGAFECITYLQTMPYIGSATITPHIYQLPEKMSGWRLVYGRLCILLPMIPKFKLNDAAGMNEAAMMKLVRIGVENSNAETRQKAIEVACEVFKLKNTAVNNFVTKYFEKQKDILKQEITNALEKSLQPKDDHAASAPCEFCGHSAPNYTEKDQSEHLLNFCPSLVLCKLCKMVVHASEFYTHILQSCAGNKNSSNPVKQCNKCKVLLLQSELETHNKENKCKAIKANHEPCPYCTIPVDVNAWEKHMIKNCKSNPRQAK